MVTSPRYTRAIEAGIPGAEGYLWQEVAHVVRHRECSSALCGGQHAALQVSDALEMGEVVSGSKLEGLQQRLDRRLERAPGHDRSVLHRASGGGRGPADS